MIDNSGHHDSRCKNYRDTSGNTDEHSRSESNNNLTICDWFFTDYLL